MVRYRGGPEQWGTMSWPPSVRTMMAAGAASTERDPSGGTSAKPFTGPNHGSICCSSCPSPWATSPPHVLDIMHPSSAHTLGSLLRLERTAVLAQKEGKATITCTPPTHRRARTHLTRIDRQRQTQTCTHAHTHTEGGGRKAGESGGEGRSPNFHKWKSEGEEAARTWALQGMRWGPTGEEGQGIRESTSGWSADWPPRTRRRGTCPAT